VVYKNFGVWMQYLWEPKCYSNFRIAYTGVQSKNNVYHNVDKVQNSFIDALILNLIDIVVYVVFALYSSIVNDQKQRF
jgi:hypothetical protein